MWSPSAQVSTKVTLQTDSDKLAGEFDLGEDRIFKIQEGKAAENVLSFLITRKDMMTGQSSERLCRVENGQRVMISCSDPRGSATCSLFVLEVRTKIHSVDCPGYDNHDLCDDGIHGRRLSDWLCGSNGNYRSLVDDLQ